MSIFTRCLPKDETQTESPFHSRGRSRSRSRSLLAREIHGASRGFARRLAEKSLGRSRRRGQQQSGLRVVYTFAVKTTVYSADGLISQLYAEPRESGTGGGCLRLSVRYSVNVMAGCSRPGFLHPSYSRRPSLPTPAMRGGRFAVQDSRFSPLVRLVSLPGPSLGLTAARGARSYVAAYSLTVYLQP